MQRAPLLAAVAFAAAAAILFVLSSRVERRSGAVALIASLTLTIAIVCGAFAILL